MYKDVFDLEGRDDIIKPNTWRIPSLRKFLRPLKRL